LAPGSLEGSPFTGYLAGGEGGLRGVLKPDH
jgi:hypothetical protein